MSENNQNASSESLPFETTSAASFEVVDGKLIVDLSKCPQSVVGKLEAVLTNVPKKRGRKAQGEYTEERICLNCDKAFTRTYKHKSLAKHKGSRTCSRKCANILAVRNYVARLDKEASGQ